MLLFPLPGGVHFLLFFFFRGQRNFIGIGDIYNNVWNGNYRSGCFKYILCSVSANGIIHAKASADIREY